LDEWEKDRTDRLKIGNLLSHTALAQAEAV